ncbi:hypothetical protein LEP1GSC192_0716 [Leptospira sp. B5-022]|nr:hypothetical protein LEP1GSC192_0716 [Leptospira sp. B5-022]
MGQALIIFSTIKPGSWKVSWSYYIKALLKFQPSFFRIPV